MQIAIRAAVFSLMTMFASCGVGAQGLDTRPTGEPRQPTLDVSNGQWQMPVLTPVNQPKQ
ncbi:hypothetical protein DKY63_02365 [Pseudomonas putida]|uniref:Lipoprotein n=1 Tax=Pseudomonas putida TaxID=303 RepID=A0A2Z4RFU0_PSEPU|nr:hypothetical protein [Pseudomonas putida]AWY38814.1 hypothetical protein DKY63_02365 [Pseudomonas putida]